ncbi:MAG: cytochrome c [Chloroflexi bacterium]|nr:cytochrome c [Chloroflexota bacterium]
MPDYAGSASLRLGIATIFLLLGCASSPPLAMPTPATAPPARSNTPAPATGSEAAPGGTGDVAKGRVVYDTYCSACHGKNAEGLAAPDLRKVGANRDRAFITSWLVEPTAVKPGTTMPKVPLTDPDLRALVDFLLTLR